MDVYVFKGALYCDTCGPDLRAQYAGPRVEDVGEDSEVCPVGPLADGGGEADTPQHCDHCNTFLQNPLTNDGRAYVQGALDNYRDSPALAEWAKFYGMAPTPTGARDVELHDLADMVAGGGSHDAPDGMTWAAVEDDNAMHYFATEGEAAAFQQGYRAAQGLDPMTGS